MCVLTTSLSAHQFWGANWQTSSHLILRPKPRNRHSGFEAKPLTNRSHQFWCPNQETIAPIGTIAMGTLTSSLPIAAVLLSSDGRSWCQFLPVAAIGTVAMGTLMSSMPIATVLLSSDGRRWRQFLLIATDFTSLWRQGRPSSLLWCIVTVATGQLRPVATVKEGHVPTVPFRSSAGYVKFMSNSWVVNSQQIIQSTPCPWNL
jgi:hypothetical protein